MLPASSKIALAKPGLNSVDFESAESVSEDSAEVLKRVSAPWPSNVACGCAGRNRKAWQAVNGNAEGQRALPKVTDRIAMRAAQRRKQRLGHSSKPPVIPRRPLRRCPGGCETSSPRADHARAARQSHPLPNGLRTSPTRVPPCLVISMGLSLLRRPLLVPLRSLRSPHARLRALRSCKDSRLPPSCGDWREQ